jgi:hypothetical protein
MPDILHLRINDPHALAIIENLEKMHAVDFLAGDEDDVEISDALKEEARRRLLHLKNNPDSAVSMQQFKSHIKSRLEK